MIKQHEKQVKKFFSRCNKFNGETIDLSMFEYKGIRIKSICKCKICGYVWNDCPEILYKRKFCPKCQEKLNKEKKRKECLKKHKENAEKIYINNNISDINFYYDDKNNLMVKFICHNKYCNGKEHGKQTQTGFYFLKGHGCAKCATQPSKAYTTEEWVNMAKSKYPEFNYNKTKYVNKVTKVTITCKKHGDFEVLPKEFMAGKLYCPYCTKERLHNEFVERVIKRAEKAHKEDGYIYHPDLIKNSYEKIGIECRKHGIFWQTINNHIKGSKCPICSKEEALTRLEVNKRDYYSTFIEKANKIHHGKYYYNKVVYKGNDKKVIITCPEHGDFKQTPHSHLAGGGCPKCARNKISDAVRISQEEFLERVTYIHRNKGYDFSNVEYKRGEDEVIVICPKHGKFNIRAMSLLIGVGCPICRMPKLEISVRNNLIENNINYISQKRFKWLGLQSLDFYLPDYNIAIECQGVQHFKEERRYKNLEAIKERDSRKKMLCKENNVFLIYYVPLIFVEHMKEDDIYFSNVVDLVDYIKKQK